MTRPDVSVSPWRLLVAWALGCGMLVGCAPAAGLSGHASALPGGAKRDGTCTYTGWSAPQPIAGFPAGSVIRSSSLALRGGHGYLVGNDIPFYDSLPAPAAPLTAVMTRDGRDIGDPAGDFLFMSPRALLGTDGTLHMLWAEPGDWRPSVREDWASTTGKTASLWHATYTAERGWSEPVQVYADPEIWWEEGTGDVTLDPAAGLHAVIGGDYAQILVHLSYDGQVWKAERIPGVEGPVYSSIAVDSAGRVYVAYVAPDQSVPSDANSVFLVRSPDGGRTWLQPQLISRSGNRQATQIRVLPTANGTVHLVWAQNVTRGVVPQVIRHVVSRDTGGTWSASEDIDIPDGLGSMRAGADPCGAVHMTYEAVVYDEDGLDEQGRLWYARWDGGWSALEQPFGKLISTEADLAVDPVGTLHLVWYVVHLGATPHQTTFTPVRSYLQLTP